MKRVLCFLVDDEDTDMPVIGQINAAYSGSEELSIPVEEELIHGWFELTYANYLVLNRSLLQSMPAVWQARFVQCLEELRDAYSHLEHAGSCGFGGPEISVAIRSADGRFAGDPIPHYERGRAYVPQRDGWSPEWGRS